MNPSSLTAKPGDQIGQQFTVCILGMPDLDHPLTEQLFDAVHSLGESAGFEVSVSAEPWTLDS